MPCDSVIWNAYVFRTPRPSQHLLEADAQADLHFDGMSEHHRGTAL